MNEIDIIDNPFKITTPEGLSAERAVSLFVEVFTDFPQVIDPGHTFLLGPRGVGKSMMFRYLQSDCQCIVKKCMLSDLPFWGVYIPMKNEALVKIELQRLERHASEIFYEHLMISHLGVKVFNSLLDNPAALQSIDATSLLSCYSNTFLPLLNSSATINTASDIAGDTVSILKKMSEDMNLVYSIAADYCKKLSFTKQLPIYRGPLLDYLDFLVPLLSKLRSVKGFPNGPVYLLIDDAHVLTDTQTRVLNSWIATRTSSNVSLKISSQYNYKNYYSVTGATIESPHDYSEVDMATVYTANSGKSNYYDRVRSMVMRRFKLANIDSSPEEFFPVDIEQEEKISKIAEDYKKAYDPNIWTGKKRSDDANRYARVDYIKSLSGKSKSSSTYNYAGFEQLVHLSSGLIRFFLEPASEMFSEEKERQENGTVKSISVSIQNQVVRQAANRLLFNTMEKFQKEGHEKAIPKDDINKLSNLIQGLGGLFRQILLSNKSERRVFSIAISDEMSEEVERILSIGVNLGFFHQSTIGRKDRKSGGRTRLFIMNRRLAPFWTLDPTSFSGYLFVQNSILEEGIKDPQSLLRRVDRSGELLGIELAQLRLFDSLDVQADMEIEVHDNEL